MAEEKVTENNSPASETNPPQENNSQENLFVPPADEKAFELQYQAENLKRELDSLKSSDKVKFAEQLGNHLQLHPEQRPLIEKLLKGEPATSQEEDNLDPVEKKVRELSNELAAMKAVQNKAVVEGAYERAAKDFLSDYNHLAERYPVMKNSIVKDAIYERFQRRANTDLSLLDVVKGVVKDVNKSPVDSKAINTEWIEKQKNAPKVNAGSSVQAGKEPVFKNMREALEAAVRRQGQ